MRFVTAWQSSLRGASGDSLRPPAAAALGEPKARPLFNLINWKLYAAGVKLTLIFGGDTLIQHSKDRPTAFTKTRYCKKTVAGNVVEYLEMSSVPSAPSVRKLSATEYLNLITGEVCQYSQSDTRADNLDSLRKSFRALRALVNANCTDPHRLHWVTLTYADNMTDTKQLYKDFDAFRKRFQRWCVKSHLTPPEYITAIEPQARGAWHMHCILIWSGKRPYIDNNAVFAPLWGHGFTKIQGVPDDCDNLGAYLSAYLSDMALGDESDDKSGKKYVKGARLSLYPVGVKIYRHSRGVQMPASCDVDPENIKKEQASAGTLTYSCSYTVIDDDGNKRYISKSYYNTKRPKSQGRKP